MTTAKKNAKQLGFKAGEAVVYPAHGVGRITAIEE
ncbi:CarD family transcriptional regulator, partial [Saliniramus sp.]